jgi:hypothetical protein
MLSSVHTCSTREYTHATSTNAQSEPASPSAHPRGAGAGDTDTRSRAAAAARHKGECRTASVGRQGQRRPWRWQTDGSSSSSETPQHAAIAAVAPAHQGFTTGFSGAANESRSPADVETRVTRGPTAASIRLRQPRSAQVTGATTAPRPLAPAPQMRRCDVPPPGAKRKPSHTQR